MKESRRGFALSIVLWIVAALLFGIATLALLAKDTQFLTKNVNAKLKTQIEAENILEHLKFYILTANSDYNSFINNSLSNSNYKFPNKIIVDNRWYEITKDIKIRLHDTSAMQNVFYLYAEDIAHLATTSSQRQERFVIIDSIKDWTDSDNIVSLNGAEASRYAMKEDVNYKIRNSPALQSTYEVRLINGIDTLSEKRWKQLHQRLYYGRATIVNLTLLDSKYLSYILKIDEFLASSLIK